jgi:ATP-dependent protease ClpP protease subunit
MTLCRHKQNELDSDVETPTNVAISKNHIYFYSNVCSTTILQLNKAINDLNEPGSRYPEIWLHINSNGGNVYDALSAVDTIKDSPTPVITIIEGIAASAGSMISIVGDKRYIRTNGTVLIHQLRNDFSGKKCDMEDDLENMKALDEKMIDIYVNNTKIKRVELRKMLKNELEFGAQKCIELGISDEIYTNTPVILGKRRR